MAIIFTIKKPNSQKTSPSEKYFSIQIHILHFTEDV